MKNDLVECQFIIKVVRDYIKSHPDQTPELVNIDNLPGASVYLRDANKIKKIITKKQTVLDWGCGAGHMSWLLANRGFSVIASDWAKRPVIPEFIDNRIQFLPLSSPTHINLPDKSLDVVLSSGTLEHAQNISASMSEIRRILKPGGWLVIFRFPNELSISEYVASRSGRWSHALRMGVRDLKFLMRLYSYRIIDIGYDSFLPIFFGKSFKFLRPIRSRWNNSIVFVDYILTKTPIISSFSTSIYCFAQVNNEYQDVTQTEGLS